MVISIVNQKGGVGKTTLTVNLAHCRAMLGERVLVADADPQGSILQWQSITDANPFDVIHLPGKLTPRRLLALDREYDRVFVDTPPALGQRTLTVLRGTALAIVPIGPSPLDIWSSRETINMIAAVRAKEKGLDARVVIYRKIPRTRIAGEAREALEAYAIPVCEAEISQRIAFVASMLAGSSVLAHAPRSPAADELQALCHELLS
jgi:chromosome partitioning protein